MKKNHLKLVLLFAIFISIIFLFQSCAVDALPKGIMRFNKKTAENGMLIGSITFPKEKSKFDGYFFRLTGNTSAEFMLQPYGKHKGQLDGGRTYLFAIERPVGQYEIPSVRLFSNSMVIALQRTNYVGGFSIPYEIKKGEITYIGNIAFNDYAAEGQKIVTLDNNYERDINALKKLKPSVDWSSAKNDESRKIEYNDKKARL